MTVLPWLLITVLIVFIDQISKIYIVGLLGEMESTEVITGFFYIIHVENSGAAWSLFQNGRYVFIALTLISLVFMAYFAIKIKDKFLSLSLSILAGGAIGNLIDRIYKGTVTDFLSFIFGQYGFPAFNAADMSIVAGSALLAYYILFKYGKNDKAADIKGRNGGCPQ